MPLPLVGARLDHDLYAAIERHRERIADATGITPSRSATIAALLRAGLERSSTPSRHPDGRIPPHP